MIVVVGIGHWNAASRIRQPSLHTVVLVITDIHGILVINVDAVGSIELIECTTAVAGAGDNHTRLIPAK